jgi:hypothetical protein
MGAVRLVRCTSRAPHLGQRRVQIKDRPDDQPAVRLEVFMMDATAYEPSRLWSIVPASGAYRQTLKLGKSNPYMNFAI